MAKIFDGRKLAQKIEAGLKIPGITPCLAVVVFKDDPAGQLYARLKAEAAQRLGIKFIQSEDETIIGKWNRDDSIHGILIQRPAYRGEKFEAHWQELVNKIAPQKDVDGLKPDSAFTPATVKAVEIILAGINIPPRGGILVIGRGMIGKALAKRLNAKSISSKDKNLEVESRKADILITACGRGNLIKTVKPGAIVIDVGWPKGDVDFDRVKPIAGVITPVPGGVGPVTVACLLENLIEAVYNQLL
ncbi:bifunctional 5,10-methylenetetrahydrofolate dehydrogenase/5,10-methenyltetrahydrofolate cyclohydrolase [Patescibacteria group bacterium]|nr:bifunctional 5,10-methylenetetrahydrofolate dehydrogenase/5,10-methenyltetrahydrofolate cyclohydrolase [Patescibacteria group bacterium]